MLTTLEEKLVPAHTALLVIDMQNDFCDDDGACARNGLDPRPAQAIVPVIERLAASARLDGATVIFVRVSHGEATDSQVLLERRRRREGRGTPIAIEGTWGVDWYGELRPQDEDLVVTKHRYSAFVNTSLDLVLRSRGIRTIVLCGTSTNVCIDSTARDGHMRDYYVVLPEDACASLDPELERPTIENIQKHFGDVVSAGEIEEAWGEPSKRLAAPAQA